MTDLCSAPSTAHPPQLLIMGIGNTLLQDEGIGIHLLNHWLKTAPTPNPLHIRALDAGTLSFTLAADIAWASHLIVLDAAQLKQAAGAVQCFENAAMDQFLGQCRCSVHEVGLMDLMDIARLTDTLPATRALIGIQPAIIAWGEQPSPEVAKAIPAALAHINRLLNSWEILP